MKSAEEWAKDWFQLGVPTEKVVFTQGEFQKMARLIQSDALEAAAEWLEGYGLKWSAAEIRAMKPEAK